MIRKIIVGLWIANQASCLYADDWHFNQPNCGHQAVGLGGAYTAIANDTSALCYNPAGLALITARNMTSSLTSYEKRTERTYGVTSSGKVDFTTTGVKGFIGGLTTDPKFLPKVPLAFVIDVPQADDSHSSITLDSPNINIKDAHLNQTSGALDRIIMIGSAIKLSPTLSLGASLGVQNATQKVTQHSDAILLSGNQTIAAIESDHLTTDFWFAVYQFGVLRQMSDRLAVGASVSYGFPLKQTQSLKVDASMTSLQSSQATNDSYPASDVKVYHYENNSGFAYRHLPLKSRVGAAYKLNDHIRLSADGQHTIPPSTEFEPTEGVTPKVDGSFGVTWSNFKPVTIYSGVYSQHDTRGKVSAESADNGSGSHIDRYGVSLFSAMTDESSEYIFGIIGMTGHGSGKSLNANKSVAVGDIATWGYQITVGLATTL